MTSVRVLFVLLTSIRFLLACGRSAGGQDPLLVEAATYHQQATAIQAAIEPQLDRADSIKTALRAQKTPTVAARLATIDSLKLAFEAWELNLVEVPGMPHNHTHDHGGHHHHADATLRDLPAGQMRDLQREMLTNIHQIQARLHAVTSPR